MTVPMIVLAVGSAFVGGLLSIGGAFSTWLEPVTGHHEHAEPVLSVPAITVDTLVLVLAGAFFAWRQYVVSTVPVTPPLASVLTLSLIHISEPTRLLSISYAVFCLKKKNYKLNTTS